MFEFIRDLVRDIGNRPTTPVEIHCSGSYEDEIYEQNVLAYANAKAAAEQETDPIKKEKMEILLANGVTDFSILDDDKTKK